MPKTILISACTADYFPLLQGLLDSVASFDQTDIADIGVLDLGLEDAQRSALVARGVRTVSPPWDYELGHFAEPAPVYFKSMTARPYLPRHFAGYEIYLWIDADCWVQDWEAVKLYLSAAAESGFACTPECDRAYVPFYGQISVLDFALECFRQCVDEQLAQSLTHFPIINSGVFAARGDAPHWQKWSAILGNALSQRRQADFYIEQSAMNVAIRTGGDATALLPARCNWMCNRATPMATADGRTLLEPHPPYHPLGIVHLTANTKHGVWGVKRRDGVTRDRSLRFGTSGVD